MIDLRSDTCSRPTPELRTVMTNAEVGDDVYGDDPTVKALERATAELLGTEDAVYTPTRHYGQPGRHPSAYRARRRVLFDQNAQALIGERPLVTKTEPLDDVWRLFMIGAGTGSAV